MRAECYNCSHMPDLKMTYTCCRCQLRFLASTNRDLFPARQRQGDNQLICLLCLQTDPRTERVMAKVKVKKGPPRKESKKAKAQAKLTARKRMKRDAPWSPPVGDL